MRRSRTAGLPLAVWAGLLSGGPVVLGCAVTATVLALTGRLGAVAAEALAAGACAGLVLSVVSVVAAQRLAEALRALHSDALQRLSDPAAPVTRPGRRPVAARAAVELAELSRTLDALHLRVRVADEVGERHRRDAETVGAGVFEMLSGLVAAEEGARGQLAAELHDTVAQSLMIARGILAGGTASAAEVARLSDYVEDAEEQVRAVMARTRPPVLRDGDLASAVAVLRADLAARYGLDVALRWPDEAHPLPLASAVTLYRFFQEALLNVVKHADVDDAEAGLEIADDAVVAWVRDEGPGFEPAAVRPDRGRHVGLGLLRDRARLAGGSLEVVSAVGAGTTAAPEREPHVPDVVPPQRAGSLDPA
ncbi:MAG TPA: ATP-binding protein [Mycobacteriales bacterium]|nr:ATP-binding protein [Mycobacteriales bacterium]